MLIILVERYHRNESRMILPLTEHPVTRMSFLAWTCRLFGLKGRHIIMPVAVKQVHSDAGRNKKKYNSPETATTISQLRQITAGMLTSAVQLAIWNWKQPVDLEQYSQPP